MHPSAAVVIPAYDCAATIETLINTVRRAGATVVVVDDGSSDDTADRAARAGAEVLQQPANRGKGAAIRRGLEWAAQNGFDFILTMDGDGQHLASEIDALAKDLSADMHEIVVGQRIIDPAAVSPNKLFGNRFANRWVEIACGQAIPDTQSGMRVYPVAATLALATRASRFAFETEVLIRAVRAGMTIRSVPVDVYYPPIDERTSHYRPVLDTVRIIFVVLGLIFRVY